MRHFGRGNIGTSAGYELTPALDGKRVQLVPVAGVTSFATPLGAIPLSTVNCGEYHMKVLIKASF